MRKTQRGKGRFGKVLRAVGLNQREYAAAQGKLKSETQAIQEVLHEC